MPNINKLFIAGHLGRDPEGRYMPNGDPVASFSIAYSEKRKGEEQTTWFRCTAYGKTAEYVTKYLGKGSAVLVEGRIQCRQYEKDGQKREAWEVTCERVHGLGGKGEKAEGDPIRTPPAGGAGEIDDDIPF